jgi:hypothetical protein
VLFSIIIIIISSSIAKENFFVFCFFFFSSPKYPAVSSSYCVTNEENECMNERKNLL